MEKNSAHFVIELVNEKSKLSGGDILFLISCTEIVRAEDRAAYLHSLVLHASDLPSGRGWSPHIWQILEGAEEVVLSLIEADDNIDSGPIWKKSRIYFPKHMLWNEINDQLFSAEIELIDFAVNNFLRISPSPQDEKLKSSYYPKREPVDSRVDPFRSISEQFDKIRICDPERYPAFFELYGHKYKLILEKIDE